jgi:hypothetical protein
MIKDITYEEIDKYSKIEISYKDFTDDNYIKIISDQLKLSNWSHAGSRVHYNNYNFLARLFDVEITKKAIILNKLINIPIKEQDYLHIKLVSGLYHFKHKKEQYFKINWFLPNGYVKTRYIDIEKNIKTHCFKKKLYRVDTYIKLAEGYYLVFEYLEKQHLNIDDEDLRREVNRLYQLMYNNQDESIKIAKIIIFWHKYINDDVYIDNIIKTIYKLVIAYKNIDDKRKWCVDAIDNEVIHSKELSEQIYDGFLDNNKPLITRSALNQLIKYKDDNSREECFADFMIFIDELEIYKNNYIEKNDEFEFIEDNDNNLL